MNSEAEVIIAFLFKRSGKTKLKESEIYLTLSIELGWFSNIESKEFVRYVVQQKLLIKKDDFLTPSFDIEKINIPIGFYPSKKDFVDEENDLNLDDEKSVIAIVVHRIVEKTNQNSKNIAKEIKQLETEKNILPEVAALLLAKDYNTDIEDIFESVENKILIEN